MNGLLRKGLYGALSLADWVLQIAVPPVRHRVCYASIPDFTDNAFYLFAHAIRTRRGLEHVWLVQEAVSTARIEAEFARLTAQYGERGHSLRVMRWRSPSAYWAFLRSAVVAHTHGVYNFSRAAVRRFRIGLWHGMPIKCIGSLNADSPKAPRQFATHYLSTSYFFRYVLAQAFDVTPSRVLVVGLPRNDALQFAQSRVRDAADIHHRLGVGEAQPFVLWLPTFRAEGKALSAPANRLQSFMDDVDTATLERFVAHARERGCVIVVKLHPSEKSIAHELLPPDSNLRVFTDTQWRATEVQLYDALGVASGLVSDVSSVLIDFAITGRPIGCFGYDARAYTRDLIFPLDYLADALALKNIDSAARATEFLDQVVAAVPKPAPCSKIFVHSEEAPASEAVLRLCLDSLTCIS
jgi:CDP-glycerol glycerophosphotransferase (TagB/SpsB family)